MFSLEKRVRENWEGYVSPLHSGIVIVFHKYVAEFCTQQAICRNIYPPTFANCVVHQREFKAHSAVATWNAAMLQEKGGEKEGARRGSWKMLL